MLMAFLTLLSGLMISGVAIYYSVAGLTSIFAAAVIPIIVMGVSLELAKLVVTVWLKQNWRSAPWLLRTYLIISVVVLMFITSIGIFGFLSKSHSDHSLVSGDVQAKVAIYDQKIQTAQENINANRKALQQMDAAVDQTLGRTTDERGAANAVSIRRSQTRERTRLNNEIVTNQEVIAKLNDESAPIRADIRKVEAEVGPIKYIAQMIYGPNPDESILEKAVSWIIILIVIVFDPLAISLLLASQHSFNLVMEQRRRVEVNDTFADELLNQTGTVDPDIDLEYDDHFVTTGDVYGDHGHECDAEKVLSPESIEEVVADEMQEIPVDNIRVMTADDIGLYNEMVEKTPEFIEPTITHTADSIIIEDADGKQVIPVEHSPPLISGDYVQNEEQKESSAWSKIANSITEEEYLTAANNRRYEKDQS
jgi:Icc-related predicted phosphoesterase